MVLKSPSAISSVSMLPSTGVKYRSSVCIMISTMPQVSWYFGRVYVSSGFMMANFGLLKSVLIPAFLPVSSLVMTAESLISLPAAEIVRMTPTGRAACTCLSPAQ